MKIAGATIEQEKVMTEIKQTAAVNISKIPINTVQQLIRVTHIQTLLYNPVMIVRVWLQTVDVSMWLRKMMIISTVAFRKNVGSHIMFVSTFHADKGLLPLRNGVVSCEIILF